MSKYLKKFETTADYTAYIATDYAKPNVSYTVEDNVVHYNPWVETRVVAKYNVTDTAAETILFRNASSYVSSMSIDGVEQETVVSTYIFSTLGEHTVKYTLIDPTTIPVGYKLRKSYAFYNCSSLTSINIPNSVTSIGNSAFYGCISLSSITVDSNNTVYDSRDNCNAIIKTSTNELVVGCKNTIIPNSVTSIGIEAFQFCRSLTSIDIPNSVTSIGQYAFSNCSGLTSCTIGSGVTRIGWTVFANCISLTSIDIPSGVTSIGDSAFTSCYSLTSITSYATTAPTIKSDTFRNVKTDGKLYVPIGSSGYDVWMGTGDYYLGKYSWTKVEQ